MTREAEILRRYRRIAVVGASVEEDKVSHSVPAYLQQHGYEIVPVNPNHTEVLGQRSYPDLASVPGPLEVVQIFRPADEVGSIVDEAVRLGAKAIWMQEGIADETAAERARAAGLAVVMDSCMRTEHQRLRER